MGLFCILFINMRPQKLYATTGEFTLLKNNKAKHIGFATDGLHYNECGVIVPQIIVFHFGTTHQDFFAFENNQMVFNNVYIGREFYLTEKYAELVKKKETTPEEYISAITECYTMRKLGF